MPSTFGWSASAFVAAVLARLIGKGLALLAELDDAAAGHLRRLEALLAPVWRVLDAADAGAIDVVGHRRPLQDLLDAAYAADDALDDLVLLQSDAMARGGEHGVDARGTPAAGAARKPKPCSPLRFLLCFSPPRNAVASSSSSSSGSHGKSSKGNKSNPDLRGLGVAFEMMAQAAYRCTSAYEHVVAGKNYATMVSAQAEAATAAEAADYDQFQNDIFGRETEVEQILEKVRFSDDPHYRLGIGVLPIVGVEGVGKTALAQFIFHHEVVKAEFPVRMWVHVSGEVQLKDELVVQMIHGVAGDAHEVEDIREILHEELTGKRFLLVLDDVSDVGDIQWKDLMRLLQPAARRSMIMVTTQSEIAANAIGTMPPLILNPLESEDYQKMFRHFAFGSSDESEDYTPLGDEWDDVEDEDEEEKQSPMEKVALELAKKMGGLPLPATAIARALFFRREDKEHWKNVLEDKLWEQRDVAGISPALWLSYQHLDPRLKQCFAYSAVFPCSHAFTKDELVQMWVAQGLIYSEDAVARPEDIGSKFFEDLVERCFFQPIGSSRYVVHNSMRKLAQAVSTDQFFMVTESSGDVPLEVRHLTIMTNNLSKLINDLSLKISHSSGSDQHFLQRIRTIIFFADFSNSDEFIEFLADIFKVAKDVRVLGVTYANIAFLPAEIGFLRHLRYLNLLGNRIADLPESVCDLHLLQVLDVRCSSPYLRAPNGITNLIYLRHLHASEPFLSIIPKIQNLSHLQELEVYKVSSISRIDALQGMTQLRGTLCLKDLHQVDVSELRKGILKGMQHLNILELSWSSSDSQSREASTDEDTLECLQPHENLKDLRITGYRSTKCPSWMLKTPCSLSNATSVFLTDCVNLKNLPPFHIMPCLEILEMRKIHSVNKVNTVPQRSDQIMFPKLKRLVFEDVLNCTEWSTGSSKSRNTVFPCLCEIQIRNCPKLRNFPDLPLTLTTMIIENVGLETLPRIQDRHSLPPSSSSDAIATSKEGRWTSRLTTLQIHQCHGLKSLGSSLLQQQHLLRSLEVLSIKNCDNVTCDLSDGFQDLTALTDLSLYDCPKLLVDKFHTSLRKLEISECFITHGAWVDDYPFLFSVWTLKVTSCPHVSTDQESSFSIEPLDWLNCLFNVCSLHLENTLLLKLSMFNRLRSLEILEIDGSRSFFDDLVEEFEWLEKLQALSIRNCKELRMLPANISTLPVLEELCIENCPALEALPASGLPTSLKRLSISKCSPRLTQRCLDDEPDNLNIAKIAVVYIDGQCISIQQK
ncbi:hypothetical protein EE612_018551 [Oryza sativa]|nr:hypothetical protein EE612_018551 [Oryza sativa]